ncbi:MAG: hypothetical protein RI949_2137 [Pseudomonadota bacterium]|jgi:2-hydroxychromene-2-carboxylate isomerase
MTPITFWFDPISPYAHLAFEHLPQALDGHSVVVDYKPVLFGALLKHHSHKGPAEIEPKRQWTFRQVAWLGRSLGIRIDMPAQHPFNPLTLLRLLLAAAGPSGLPNRHQVEQVFHHVWHGGWDPVAPDRIAALCSDLGVANTADLQTNEIRERLRALTDEALAKGIFGVPTFECRGHLLWGLDALPMLRALLEGDPWFENEWEAAARPVPGVVRT